MLRAAFKLSISTIAGAALLLAPLAARASFSGSSVGIPDTRRVPQDVAAADFNGDGIQDLAIAYAFDDEVDWYFGRPDGNYDFGGSLSVGTHGAAVTNDLPRKLAVADFDGDGFLDIAVVCSGVTTGLATTPSLGILYGLPGGGFEPFRQVALVPAATASPRYSTSLAVGLVDGDDEPDIVVGHLDSHQVSVILHDAGRRWKTPILLTDNTAGSAGPYDLKLADIDLDGDLDLVAINAKNVQIWRGKGDGTFEAAHPLANLPSADTIEFTAGALADFDRDGQWDLAVLDASSDLMRIYMGLGALGTYQRTVDVALPANSGAIGLAIDDADLDGRRDAAVAYNSSGGAQWFMGQAPVAANPLAAPLVAGRTIPTGAAPRSIHAWRANGDPWADLVTANEGDFAGSSPNASNDDITIDLGVAPRLRRPYFQALPVANNGVNAVARARLSRPEGLAWDAGTQSLWTIDRVRRQLVQLDENGAILSRMALADAAAGTLADPVDATSDGEGGLWLADRIAGYMIHIGLDGGLLGSFPTGAGGITRPTAAAYDAQGGRIFVVDDLSSTLTSFDSSGNVLQTWSTSEIGQIQSLGWDSHHGELWAVMESAADRIAILQLPTGAGGGSELPQVDIEEHVSFSNVSAALAAGSIRAIEVDGDDDCFWVLSDSGGLLRLGLEDHHVEATAELSLFQSVAAAATEADGSLLAGDGGALGTIVRMNAAGDATTTFSLGRALGRPVRLAGLARSPTMIYALDALAGEIIVLSPSFQVVDRFASNTLRGKRPDGLSYNPDDNSLLVGMPGTVLEIPLDGNNLPQLNSSPQSHPIPPDRGPGSISHGNSSGSHGVYDARSGALDLFDAQWNSAGTVAERIGFPGAFDAAGALPVNAAGSKWLFYGAGGGASEAPLALAALVIPTNAANDSWTLYR